MPEEITKLLNSVVANIKCLLQPTSVELEKSLKRPYDDSWNTLVKLKYEKL